jgi:hypothetical protein
MNHIFVIRTKGRFLKSEKHAKCSMKEIHPDLRQA